jgi:iron complex outermembrane receptor protein
VGPAFVNLYLRATNLTNEEARDHLSFLKEVLPLAGRSVLVGVRTTF